MVSKKKRKCNSFVEVLTQYSHFLSTQSRQESLQVFQCNGFKGSLFTGQCNRLLEIITISLKKKKNDISNILAISLISIYPIIFLIVV